jgi:membrane-associated phospholipid phosphatase
MPGPPLIPLRLRRPAVFVALGCWVLAALLGAWYAGDHQPGRFDNAVADVVHGVVGEQGMFARFLTGPTHPIVVYPVIALVIGIAVFQRWWERAVLAVAAPGVCVVLTELLFKPLVDRTDNGVLSYPSGHTVSAVAALTVAALVVSVDWPAAYRVAIMGLLLVVSFVLAVGLVGMDYHYATDTVGGFLVALGVTLPLTLATDRYSEGLGAPAAREGQERSDTSNSSR